MKKSSAIIGLFILLLIPLARIAGAQVNHLDKKISIDLDQVKLKNALPKIGESGDFQFSYNSEIIPGDSIVSVHAQDQSVNTVLKDLVGPDIRYKVLGNHIILLSNTSGKRTPKNERKLEYTISGYIYDAQTGAIISSASIYEVQGMVVSATDENGYYTLTVPGDRDDQVFSYSKSGYADTLIVVKPKEQSSLNISLSPQPRKLSETRLPELPVSGLNERKMVQTFVPSKVRVAAENIPVIEKKWAQISLFPFVGSNRFVSGLMTNRLSLNVFAGYSGAIRGLELGSFLNIVRKEMYGVQMSGFGNIVGTKTKGVQMAGFFNVDAGSLSGLQASGFSNVVTDTIRGVQLSGFSNVLRGPMYGIQVSGFSNFTSQNVDGIQASGFSNVAIKDVRVAQLSGFANYSKSVTGLQAAGFANIASGTNTGVQAAGFLNYATEVRGLQIALFNIADTVSAGTPIGLLSFVVKGYHTLEVTANELFPLQASFKTGTRLFYNILTAGLQREWFSVGYGVGTQFRIAKKLTCSMDLTSSYVANKQDFTDYQGALIRLTPTLDIELAKRFKLVLGPTLNGFAGINDSGTHPDKIPVLFSLPIYNQTVNTYPLHVWIGATAGFRF